MTKRALPWLKNETNSLLAKAWDRLNWDKIGAGFLTGLKSFFKTLKNKPELLAIGPAIAAGFAFGPLGGLIAGAIALGLIANRDKISEAFSNVMVSIGDVDWENVGEGLLSGIESLFNLIKTWIVDNPEAIAEAFFLVLVQVPFYLGEAIGNIASYLINELANYIIENPEKVAAAFAILILAAFALPLLVEAIPYIIAGILIAGIAKGLWDHKDTFILTWIHLVVAVTDGIKSLFEWMGQQLAGETVGAILTAFFPFIIVGGALYNLGRDIISGIWTGMASLFGWVQDRLGEWAASLPGWMRKILGIASPSKVFAKIGRQSMEGYVEGVRSMLKEAQGAVSAVASVPMYSGRASVPSGITSSGITSQSSLSRQMIVESGAIVVQDSNNPSATAEEILRRLRFFDAGAK
jgi:hypothetical protein